MVNTTTLSLHNILANLNLILPFWKLCTYGSLRFILVAGIYILARDPLEEKTSRPEPIHQPPAVPPVAPEGVEDDKENKDPNIP